MQRPNTVPLWLGQQALPLGIIFILLALVMIVLYVSARRRRAQMNLSRSGSTEETFVNSLVPHGFDPHISSITYKYLQETQRIAFPIQANDLLDEDLGLDLAEVDESIVDILDLTERLYQPGMKHMPLVTVQDLVRFVQASPRLVERAA